MIKQICKTLFTKKVCGEEFLNAVLNFRTKNKAFKIKTSNYSI